MSSVDYATFVNDLHRQIRARYQQVHGVPAADSDVAHNEWRCAVENMAPTEMLARIDPAWVPTTPTTDALEVRGDFLTNRYQGRVYNLGTLLAEPAACAEYRAKGYTDVAALVISSVKPLYNNPAYDFLEDPLGFLERVQRYADAGLRCIVVIGFEGNKPKQAHYGSSFLPKLETFLRAIVAHPAISCIAPGLEIGEWSNGDQMLKMFEVIHRAAPGKPIVPHFNGPEWGSAPGSTEEPHHFKWGKHRQRSFWVESQARCPGARFAVGFQSRHVKRANGGFGPVVADVKNHITGSGSILLPGRLGGLGIPVIYWEGYFNGTDPVAPVVKEEEARAFGKKAIEWGYIGSLNGC